MILNQTLEQSKKRFQLFGIFGMDREDTFIFFRNLRVEKLETAHKSGFLRTDDHKRSAPLVKEILSFMRENKKVTAEGYLINYFPNVTAATINGLRLDRSATRDEILIFRYFVATKIPDILDDNYAWWN